MLMNGQALFLVWKNERPLGILLLYQKRQFAPEYVFLKHDFPNSFIDRELMDLLLQCFLASWPSSEYLVLTSMNPENDYLEQLFSVEISEERELFELAVQELDRELLRQAGPEEAQDDIRIINKASLPPSLLEEYYQMILELNKDVVHRSSLFDEGLLAPEQLVRREKMYRQRGAIQIEYIARSSRELIGFTEVTIMPDEPEVAYQNMTGIRPAFRGRGLGRRLKVEMMQQLLEAYPAVKLIKTAIHLHNIPSQRLNRQLGFQKVGTYKEYIISKASILRYLKI